MEFRWGHSTYLVFILSITNFILITYNFLIEGIPLLKFIFPDVTLYLVLMPLVYVPLAILIGHYHRKSQIKIDSALSAQENPYMMEILSRLENIESAVKNLKSSE